MKLDRNTNPDGRGKYAVINLRRNTVEWGGTAGEQFFVIKYKDKFASRALTGYADAIVEEILRIQQRLAHMNNVDMRPALEAQITELREFEQEMRNEAKLAAATGSRIPT